jgi:integrase
MVTIRYEKLKSGKYSIYLDCYSTDTAGNRNRKKEYLKKYVHKDYSKGKKVLPEDKDTVREAEEIRVQVQKEIFGKIRRVKVRQDYYNLSLIKYLEAHLLKTGNGATKSILHNMKKFTGDQDVLFKDITATWLEEFRDFLLQNISPNTVNDYLRKLGARLNMAIRDGIIQENPIELIEKPKPVEVEITPLDKEDLLKLLKEPLGSHPQLKLAFLFSCFTGLRSGDIRGLTWERILKENKNWWIKLKPYKTVKKYDKTLKVPMTKDAVKILHIIEKGGKETKPEDKIFQGLPSEREANDLLKLWAAYAGVTKNVHFHQGRHSFATIGLTYGIDIYSVSKLLGHGSVRMTEKYAKLIQAKKQNEIMKLPTL